jgi:nitroreductase
MTTNTPGTPPITTPDALLAALSWRYAVKKFDPARKIEPGLWSTLEKSIVLAASSYGLQPWRFVVVTNPEVRKNLRAVSWNQPQITDASHLVVFCRKAEVTTADVDAFIDRVAAVRGAPREALKDYRNMMAGHMSKPETLPGGDMATYTRSQTYIALGFFLSAAAMLGVDACPMEGFDPKKYDEILGLPAQGYHAVVLATAGYRAADDGFAAMKKVRHAHETIVKHV